MKIAVIGGGGGGLLAAWRLGERHEVVLYEAEARLGGHVHTAEFQYRDGGRDRVDMGVTIIEPLLYPQFTALLKELGIETEPFRLFYSARLDDTLEWNNDGQASPYLDHMRPEMERFYRECVQINRKPANYLGMSTAQYLAQHGYSPEFGPNVLAPILSFLFVHRTAQLDLSIAFVAMTFAFDLNSFTPISNWRTVVGGMVGYIDKIASALRGEVRMRTKVTKLHRRADGVRVRDASGHEDRFDAAIVSTPADITLEMLGDPRDEERELLGAVRYEPSVSFLHRDPRVMPADRARWAPFYYVRRADMPKPYYTYNLRAIQSWLKEDIFATSSPPDGLIAPEAILGEIRWSHLIYDVAQEQRVPRYASLQGHGRTWFCGEYTRGQGHELTLRSAFDTAQAVERALTSRA